MGSSTYPYWTGSAQWTWPVWLLNAFFFWAEYDDYRRERRNYDGWNYEIRQLMGEDLPKSWRQRVNQLRKPRD